MHKHFANVVWVYLATFLVIPITYTIRIMYAQNLSLEDFGIFYGLFAFFAFFGFFRDWGLNNAVIYFANKYTSQNRPDKIKTLFWFNQIFQLILSIFIGILLILLKNYIINTFYPVEDNISKIFSIFILYWIVFTIYNTNTVFLTIFQNQKANAFLNFIYFGLILIVSVFLFNSTFQNFIIPTFAYLFSAIFSVIISMFYILHKYKAKLIVPAFYKQKDLFSEVFVFASSVILAGVAGTLMSSSDKIIIQYFKNANVVAIYSVAFSTAILLTIFVAPFQKVIQPILSEKWHKKEIAGIEYIVSAIFNNYLMFILPLVLSFIVFADNFVLAVYGQEFISAAFIIKILAVGVLIMTINSFMSVILSSLGKPKILSKVVVITAVCNVILSVFFIIFWGILGVALATVLSSILRLYLYSREITKIIKINFDILNNFKIILSSALFLIISFVLKYTIYKVYVDKVMINFFLNCLIIFGIAGIFYVISLFLSKTITILKINQFKEIVYANEKIDYEK
ncbi:MAG: oligosaccharide flippase family protein [Candidatus Cloacimonetes bacterium]|nr:oligosaccharide flippase family protein [Candidatus Cloacimonadota bacterium]